MRDNIPSPYTQLYAFWMNPHHPTSFIYLFIYLFICLFIYLLIYSFIYLFIYSLFVVGLQLMK